MAVAEAVLRSLLCASDAQRGLASLKDSLARSVLFELFDVPEPPALPPGPGGFSQPLHRASAAKTNPRGAADSMDADSGLYGASHNRRPSMNMKDKAEDGVFKNVRLSLRQRQSQAHTSLAGGPQPQPQFPSASTETTGSSTAYRCTRTRARKTSTASSLHETPSQDKIATESNPSFQVLLLCL